MDVILAKCTVHSRHVCKAQEERWLHRANPSKNQFFFSCRAFCFNGKISLQKVASVVCEKSESSYIRRYCDED